MRSIVKIRKSGNSITITINSQVLKDSGLKVGDAVIITPGIEPCPTLIIRKDE